ncbi:MAG: MATE family efflux transporter [Planctomycetota bacterium]
MQKNPALERTRRLAESPIPQLLLRLSLPAVVGMLTAGVYNFIDGAFIGQAVGRDGLAGVTIALPYMLVLMATGMLIGFGAAAQVSIKLGEKQTEEAEQVLGNAAMLAAVISLVLMIAGLLALNPVLRLFDVSAAVLPYARGYLGIIIFATGLQVTGYGLNSVIRAEGNTRTAMWTLLIGVLLNVLLAWLFLFKFPWKSHGEALAAAISRIVRREMTIEEVKICGVALATAISQGVSAVWVVIYFLGGKSTLRLRWHFLRFDWKISRKILLIGSPMFALQVASAMMYGVMLHQLNRFGGDQAVAVWGSVYRFMMLVAMPVFGINQGTQPAIGFNFGAKRFDRVKQALLTGILYASTITTVGFAIAYLIPAQVISLFVAQEAVDRSELINLGVHATRLCFLLSPLIGFQVISATYFQATRKPRQALFLMLSRQAFLIPLLWILPQYFTHGLDGVWMAWPFADAAASILTGICLYFELKHLDSRHQETTLAATAEE